MYEMRRFLRAYRWGLEKAYGLQGRVAFMSPGRRQSKKTDDCLIKNPDAYEVVERMQRQLLEVTLAAEEALREV